MMSTERNKTMRALHAALSERGMMDEKRLLIQDYTHGRTDRASQLSNEELEQLVHHLNAVGSYSSKRNRMIRSLYFHARQLGWFTPNGNGGVKVDAERLNAWCQKHTPAHLPFVKMDDQQLAMAVTLIKKVVTSDMQSINRHTKNNL